MKPYILKVRIWMPMDLMIQKKALKSRIRICKNRHDFPVFWLLSIIININKRNYFNKVHSIWVVCYCRMSNNRKATMIKLRNFRDLLINQWILKMIILGGQTRIMRVDSLIWRIRFRSRSQYPLPQLLKRAF